MREFRLTKEAALDIEELGSWYRAHESRKAELLKQRLRELSVYLTHFAYMYPEHDYGLRKAKIAGFDYCAFYAVSDLEVVVIAVLANRSGPGTLRRRLAT